MDGGALALASFSVIVIHPQQAAQLILITILGFLKARLPRFGRARQGDIGTWIGCARGAESGEIGAPLVRRAVVRAKRLAQLRDRAWCYHLHQLQPPLLLAKMPGAASLRNAE